MYDPNTIITKEDLADRNLTEKATAHINKHEAAEDFRFLATQYRRSQKKGGGSPWLAKGLKVIGNGIAAKDLESWLLNG